MNNRRKLVIALGACALAAPFGSFAQQQGKVWRVGFLGVRSRSTASNPDVTYHAFMQGMPPFRELEWRLWDFQSLAPSRCTSAPGHLLPVVVTSQFDD